MAAVGKAHNYDMPMIVSETTDESSGCWKGVIRGGSAELAAEAIGSLAGAACGADAEGACRLTQGRMVRPSAAAAACRFSRRRSAERGIETSERQAKRASRRKL